jgi:hypothetical protein
MFADPLSRASHTSMLHVTNAILQPSRWRIGDRSPIHLRAAARPAVRMLRRAVMSSLTSPYGRTCCPKWLFAGPRRRSRRVQALA